MDELLTHQMNAEARYKEYQEKIETLKKQLVVMDKKHKHAWAIIQDALDVTAELQEEKKKLREALERFVHGVGGDREESPDGEWVKCLNAECPFDHARQALEETK